MLALTRSELEADIAEFSAVLNQEFIPETCLGCGARGVRQKNGSGGIAHNIMSCGSRERKLLESRLSDLDFLDEARKRSKFGE